MSSLLVRSLREERDHDGVNHERGVSRYSSCLQGTRKQEEKEG